MLAIARGLMARPRLLLLDEPSLGLAPKVIDELFAALDRLRAERMTVLLVDQMAGLALALADRAYVIEGGRISRAAAARPRSPPTARWRRPTSARSNAPAGAAAYLPVLVTFGARSTGPGMSMPNSRAFW